MHAANIVSVLSTTQAKAMNEIEAQAKKDITIARSMLESLLSRTCTASARHSIRLQAQSLGLM
jgi:hypothetical protein